MAGTGMSCYFCREYRRIQSLNECREDVNPKLHHEYGTILLQIAWNDMAGRHHWSEAKHRPRPEGFRLRFCPECGRRLDEGRRPDNGD